MAKPKKGVTPKHLKKYLKKKKGPGFKSKAKPHKYKTGLKKLLAKKGKKK